MLLSTTVLAGAAAVLLPASALAVCTPSAGAGTPPAGTVVTCSGTTTNQNNPNGYGDGTQNGLTINVQSGATVQGSIALLTAGGLSLGSQNTVNNAGLISAVNAIFASGPLTVNNTGTLTGSWAIQLSAGAIDLVNSGSTSGFVSTTGNVKVNNTGTMNFGGGFLTSGINGATADLTNSGSITSGGAGVFGSAGGSKVVNSSSISTTSGPAVLLAGQNNIVTNTATGTLTGVSSAFAGASITIDNAGIITGIPISGIAIGANNIVLTNSGTIAATSIGLNVDATATVVNTGTISGTTGLFAGGGSSNIFNAGTITATANSAVVLGGGSNTLTLAPTSVINGVVQATAATDALQLGGSGVGSFDVSSIGTTAGQYRRFGSFAKVGDSTWALTGSNEMALPWTVKNGILAVTGSMPNSTFNVSAGATLGGTGTVGSTTVNSGGTLSPGSSIGVININGNLVLGAGAIYLVEVSTTGADKVNVSGTASLAGEARLVFGPGAYTANTFSILSAGGGRFGTFDTVTMSGLPAGLSASLSYTSTDVLLVTLVSSLSTLPVSFAPNQNAVAAAQDAAFNKGLPNIGALYGLPVAQLPAALDQLSGEVHASTAGALLDESLYARNAVLGRLRQASYGGNTQMASLTMGGPQAFAGDEEISALAYAKSPAVTKTPPMGAPGPDVVFWAQGFGARGRFEANGNATGVRRDLAGFFSGVDTRIGSNGRLGVAAGYTASQNALDGRGSSNVETGHVSGYGGWAFGNFNLRTGGAFAWHTIDTSRTIVFPGFFDTATAHYNGRTGQIFGEAGYGFAFGNVAVEPFAGGAWVRLNTDGFNERANLAGLAVAASTFEVGYSSVGVRAASMIPLGNDMILIPRASLAWQHAFNNVTPEARLAFIAAPVPFVIAGTPIARDSLLGEAGLDLAIGRNATVGVSYTGQLARNVHDHAAKGKFSWKF